MNLKQLKEKANKYIPDYDPSKWGEWSMSREETQKIMTEAGKLLDKGDEDGYFNLIAKIPLFPNMALMLRDEIGKEALLASNHNLADAAIVYGEDWIDNYKIDPE